MCGERKKMDDEKNRARKEFVSAVKMKNLSNVKLFVFILELKLYEGASRPQGPKTLTFNTRAHFSHKWLSYISESEFT